MTISSEEDADTVTIVPVTGRDEESYPVRPAHPAHAPAAALSPQVEAFIVDRFRTVLEDPLTGRKTRSF